VKQKLSQDLNVSRETILKLEEYVELLIKWNQKINLISKNDIPDIWNKHIILCAEVIKYIDNKDIKSVDLGSGGGFPGIILSILGMPNVTLIESNSKKTAFLLQASKISNFSVRIINDRIEKQQIECDIITSRAFASINQLLECTKYVRFKKFMLLLKGPEVAKEIPNTKDFSFQIKQSRYNPLSNIVLVKHNNNE